MLRSPRKSSAFSEADQWPLSAARPTLRASRRVRGRRHPHRGQSRFAGRASTAITDQYTLVGLKHQDELTRRIHEKRAKADKEIVAMKKKATAA